MKVRLGAEFVPDTGLLAANGNDSKAAKDERQQTLFSCVDFMAEEPVNSKRRGNEPQLASLSMFERALAVEREREEEPVSAER